MLQGKLHARKAREKAAKRQLVEDRGEVEPPEDRESVQSDQTEQNQVRISDERTP